MVQVFALLPQNKSSLIPVLSAIMFFRLMETDICVWISVIFTAILNKFKKKETNFKAALINIFILTMEKNDCIM